MTVAAVLMCVSFTTASANVSTLDGKTTSGNVTAIGNGAVSLEANGKASSLPLDSVLEIRFEPNSASQTKATEAPITVQLADGSRLTCRQVTMMGRTLVADTLSAGELKVPWNAVRAVRFRDIEPAIEKKWDELSASAPERDLLVVRNGDVLDRLEGTISGLDESTLTFLVGDTRVPIDRAKPKLFGVIPGKAQLSQSKPLGELHLHNGDVLTFAGVELKGDTLAARLLTGSTVTIPLEATAALDFGQGKVTFLSQLQPRAKEHSTRFNGEFDSVFDVRIDHSDAGREAPIRIDRQVYQRGLVIHSETKLTYRLNGDFRRFVAVAGIEQLVRPNGRVTLSITADGKELFSRDITGKDPPLPLDLDVSGVRELTIFVGFGGDLDDGDHLALGDARLIK
jgi:hypothetical protein